MKTTISFVMLMCAVLPKGAQCCERADTSETMHGRVYERALELKSEDGSAEPLVDLFNSLEENPLDLNQASAAELEQIPGVGPLLAHRIVLHRAEKPFEKLSDLQGIDGVTPQISSDIAAFAVVAPRESRFRAGRSFVDVRTRIARNLNPASVKGLLGSVDHVYSRVVAQKEWDMPMDPSNPLDWETENPTLSVGFLTDKDPGEKSYADAIAGYLCAKLPDLHARVIVGDFTMEAGQGMVFWRPSTYSKGCEAASNAGRNGIGLRPSLSASGSWFFRGIGASISYEGIEWSVFYSNKPLDAAVDSMGNITSFATDDLHRTEQEMRKRDSGRESGLGSRVQFNVSRNLSIGASACKMQFNHAVARASSLDFAGREAVACAIDASYTQRDVSVQVEIAESQNHSVAGIAGLSLSPGKGVDLALSVRSYPKTFVAYHGSALSEAGASNSNESGIYWGVAWHHSHWLTASMFYDQFFFPWRKTNAALPSAGNDFLAAINAHPSDRISLEARIHRKLKPQEMDAFSLSGRPTKVEGLRDQRNIRFTANCVLSKWFTWESRMEVVAVAYPSPSRTENGMLAYQDFVFNFFSGGVVWTRIVAFRSDSYDSRIYESEDELPGSFSNPAQYGNGIRWTIMARLQNARAFTVTLKFGQTQRERMYFSGSSPAVSPRLVDRDLAAQIDLKL